MYKPKISVALSTYNRENMLPRMLNCLLNQDFTDYELVLINNGSIDNTVSVCNMYKDKDSRIRVFSLPKNIGPAGAKNFALQKATAGYICFVDDDDFCESNYLSLLYSLVKQYNADIAVTGCVDEYDDKIITKFDYSEVYIWNKVEATSEFLKREKFNAAPPTKIFRKSLFNNISFIQCFGPDDIHVIYKLFVKADKVVVTGKPTYRFHKHDDNITAYLTQDIITGQILDIYFKMQKERVRYISNRLPELAAQVRYAAWSYMISMVEKIKTGHGKDCGKQLIYMINELRNNKDEFLSSEWLTEREKNLMTEYVLI